VAVVVAVVVVVVVVVVVGEKVEKVDIGHFRLSVTIVLSC